MNYWRDKDEFKRRALEWAGKLGIEVRSLSVRPMRNKWASCSVQGNLNFNAELVGLDREIGDYVIVHELLHFFVPNHGKLWKSLMRVHLGDYEEVKERLTRNGLTPPSDPLPPSLTYSRSGAEQWSRRSPRKD